MIYGYLYQGSGAGNQLHRYIATRVKAIDLGVDYRMIYVPDNSGKVPNFKCQSFMEFDGGKIVTEVPLGQKVFNEKKVVENGVDIRGYDPEINFVGDWTTIDGEFQDERYFEHRMKEVDEWLKVEPLEMDDNLCVIGFRGGEFSVFPDLFLTKEYWAEAKVLMLQKNINMKFEVHTDDEVLARQFFPGYKIIHDIGINWRSMRYAKYAIIANSSFYILPRLLRDEEKHAVDATYETWGTDKDCNGRPISALKMTKNSLTIAPKYWARRNTGVWCLPQNYYKQFRYI